MVFQFFLFKLRNLCCWIVYVFAAGMEELKATVPPHWLASVYSQHTRGEGVEHLRTYLPSCACTYVCMRRQV
jgi:hypothetical protein